jgi:hypothetical protein
MFVWPLWVCLGFADGIRDRWRFWSYPETNQEVTLSFFLERLHNMWPEQTPHIFSVSDFDYSHML